MKFRLKMTLSVLTLLSLLFGIGGSLLISASFSDSLEREKEGAFNNYRMVWGTLQIVNELAPQLDKAVIARTMEQLYEQNTAAWTSLRLSAGDEVLYETKTQSAIPQGAVADETPEPGYCLSRIVSDSEGGRYLTFSCAAETNGAVLCLTASRDVSSLYLARQAQQSVYLRIFAVMCLLCGVLSYTVSRLLTAPLENLSRAARAIAAGNYASRVRVKSRDEIGTLSEDFNAMARQLEGQILELRQSVERQERFAGSFAHEMKTPMTSLIGYAELIRSGTLTAQEQAEAADYLYSEGKRLERLGRKLLELLVVRQEELTLARVDPAQLIEALAQRLRPIYEEKHMQLSFPSGFREKDLV